MWGALESISHPVINMLTFLRWCVTMHPHMKRIDDIAKEAGVSRATVSRVLNGHLSVTPETARHVKRAMEQAGYVPAVNRRGPRPKGKAIDEDQTEVVTVEF